MNFVAAILVFAQIMISFGTFDCAAYKFALGLSRQAISIIPRFPCRKKILVNTSTFAHNSGHESSNDVAAASIHSLVKRAQTVKEKLYGTTNSSHPPLFVLEPPQLSYPQSTYDLRTDNDIRSRTTKNVVRRGFCNWLVPNIIMIGQYPGMTPETNGPTSNECQLHLQNMVQDAKVTLFCCLQTEVPSQDDDFGWDEVKLVGDGIFLKPEYLRREFPRPFTRYGPLAQSFAESQLTFLHHPIEDLGVPSSNDSLVLLLSKLMQHLEIHDHPVIYLHCWGGRGRAGLVGSCMASLLFPKLSSAEILDWVQSGYDTRSGVESMHDGLKRSPQTEQQRQFVREFISCVHTKREEVLD